MKKIEEKKQGRPESKNVPYFPHFVHESPGLRAIVRRHGNDGYASYYRLLEQVADAPFHRICLEDKYEWEDFIFRLGVSEEVGNDLINILIRKEQIDKDAWESKKILWMDDFIELLRPAWYKRDKKDRPRLDDDYNILPQKEDRNRLSDTRNSISDIGNSYKRKERKEKQENKNKESRVSNKDDHSTSIKLLFSSFMGNNDISTPPKIYNTIYNLLDDGTDIDTIQKAINNYHDSKDVKDPYFFFNGDYVKYLQSKSSGFNYDSLLSDSSKRLLHKDYGKEK